MTLMNSSINMVNGPRNYGGVGSETGNPVLNINNYNCRGFMSSMEDIKASFRSSDILAIQEHWLNPAEFEFINQVDADVRFSAVSP